MIPNGDIVVKLKELLRLCESIDIGFMEAQMELINQSNYVLYSLEDVLINLSTFYTIHVGVTPVEFTDLARVIEERRGQ